jgi:hypothetical protein
MMHSAAREPSSWVMLTYRESLVPLTSSGDEEIFSVSPQISNNNYWMCSRRGAMTMLASANCAGVQPLEEKSCAMVSLS